MSVGKTIGVGALVMLLASLLLAQIGVGRSKDSGDGRLRVVATTTQIADFARTIGGQYVQVHGLLSANVEPHDYEPTTDDAIRMSEADVIFVNGVGLDDWVIAVVARIGGKGDRVADLSADITLQRTQGEDDPHIWHSVPNAVKMVRTMQDRLTRLDPTNGAAYSASANSYIKQLETLDAWIAEQINTIPAAQRKMVTNHDTFGYYIERYNLEFVGSVVPSVDDNAEPSPQEIASLVDRIRDLKVKAVFTESSMNPSLARRIAADTGVRTSDSLYGDTLGPDGSDGDTYVKMQTHNTNTIVAALK